MSLSDDPNDALGQSVKATKPSYVQLGKSGLRVSVPILGATTAGQLSRSLQGIDATVAPDLARRIDAVHRDHPLPY